MKDSERSWVFGEEDTSGLKFEAKKAERPPELELLRHNWPTHGSWHLMAISIGDQSGSDSIQSWLLQNAPKSWERHSGATLNDECAMMDQSAKEKIRDELIDADGVFISHAELIKGCKEIIAALNVRIIDNKGQKPTFISTSDGAAIHDLFTNFSFKRLVAGISEEIDSKQAHDLLVEHKARYTKPEKMKKDQGSNANPEEGGASKEGKDAPTGRFAEAAASDMDRLIFAVEGMRSDAQTHADRLQDRMDDIAKESERDRKASEKFATRVAFASAAIGVASFAFAVYDARASDKKFVAVTEYVAEANLQREELRSEVEDVKSTQSEFKNDISKMNDDHDAIARDLDAIIENQENQNSEPSEP